MNNRASNKPPQEYFAGYDSQSHSEKDEDTYVSTHSRQPSQAAMMLKDEKDGPETDTNTNRQFGIFKFGSKLAATFNPSKWKIWQKEKPGKDNSIAERLKADAEFKRAYEEVKKRGYIQGNRPGAMASVERSQTQLNSQHQSDVAMEDASQATTESAHGENQDTRTSGQSSPTRKPNVIIPSISQAELETKYQRPFPRTPIKLPAVTPEDSISNYSSSSTSPRKGPSLLQGAFNDDPTRPTLGRIVDPPPSEERRRQPLGKKETEKQLNLVTKVSILEFKLRAAQEELALSMGMPIPPRKTQTGIDYEAIHAIQLQKQQEHGPYIATTAAAFIHPPRCSSRMTEASASGEHGDSAQCTSGRASLNAGASRAPLALVVNGETSPCPGTLVPMPTIELPSDNLGYDPYPVSGLNAEETHHLRLRERRADNTQQRMYGYSQTKKCFNEDDKHHPSSDSARESEESSDTTTTRAAVKRVKSIKSGPRRHNVEVVLPNAVSKVRSVSCCVEGHESRRRPLNRSGEDVQHATPEPALSKISTPSNAASMKSTRSSRIQRPRSREGSPARGTREMAPPVPPLPTQKLVQAHSILKKSGSTKCVKATNKRFAVEIPAQRLQTPPRKGTRHSREKTPTPKNGRRRSTSTTTRHGKSHASQDKSPLLENSLALAKSGSVKGGLYGRGREMSPSKEGTFEWGPDVF